jgi:class 3 adenylate cyclase
VDERPVTRYAKTADGVSLVYQVIGDGPMDLVMLAADAIAVDLLWEEPNFVRLARRLRGFSRTIWCESRGMGASGGVFLDGFDDEIAQGDVTAVLDQAGCGRVVLVGSSEGGPNAIRYAASHPERVAALVLINTFAHYVREDDYPSGVPRDALEKYAVKSGEQWGTGASTEILAPSRADDAEFRAWWARSERLGLGRQDVAAVRTGFLRDMRALLPTLALPTLVLHREADRFIRADAGRYLAEHIPGAAYVELPGADHPFFVGDVDALAGEIEEFLTGSRQAPEGDVITATILFTDIVDSTEQSARLGHRKWTALIDGHDAMVRASLARHRGREVKTTGDGFHATFDATTRAVRAAQEIVTAAKAMGLEVRVGLHAGEIEVRPDDVVGLPVNIAKRICDLARPGQVLVSRTIADLTAGSDLVFDDCGEQLLKGVPGLWHLFTTGL